MVKLTGHLNFPDFHVYVHPVIDCQGGSINYTHRPKTATFFWMVAKEMPESLS